MIALTYPAKDSLFLTSPRVLPPIGLYSLVGWTSLALGLVTAFIGSTETIDSSFTVRTMNVLVPVYMLAGLPIVAYICVRSDPLTVWTPMVLFLGHTALFKGLGPLASQFGNTETQAYLREGAFSLTNIDQLQTNILNAVATGVIMLSIVLMLRLRPVRRIVQEKMNSDIRRNQRAIASAAIGFLALGIINLYGVILPYEWGLEHTPPPGLAITLRNLIDLGLALIIYLSVKRGGIWTILFWIIFPMHFLSLSLGFRKSVMMLAILLPALTAYIAHGNTRRLMVWILSAVVIYTVYSPIAGFGRDTIIARGGDDVYNASLSERLEIVETVVSNPQLMVASTRQNARQNAWLRLDYSGPQSYVMREYDRGFVNPTLLDGLWRLIPKVLWPEKPETSGPGRWFYQYVTQSDREARVGVTFYADAYWNGGWTVVVLICGVIGTFFGIATAFVMRWLRSYDFIMFPAILLIADFTLRGLNGWIQNGYALIPYLLVYATLVCVSRVLTRS